MYTRLRDFHAKPSLKTTKMTNHHSSIYRQLFNPISQHSVRNSNRYSSLSHSLPSNIMETSNKHITTANSVTPVPKSTTTPHETLWVTDTGVTRLSEVIINQPHIDRQNQEAIGDTTNAAQPKYKDPAFKVIPPVNPIQHMRYNLIRHRDTTCNITTLILFKSFASVLQELNSDNSILPYEANKHHISPLTNVCQINAVDDNKLKLYFCSYHRKQLYSLSGYFHIGMTITPESLFNHPKMLEWLDSHRYYIKLSSSQIEEMVQIRALISAVST
jgi:hypothetical protein